MISRIASRIPCFTRWFLLGACLLGMLVPARAQTNPPTILRQPAGGQAMIGEDFGFSVVADGAAPLRYQWFFNGAPILQETNTWLTISNVTSSAFGSFQVQVTNSLGQVMSSVANLNEATTPPRLVRNGNVGSRAGKAVIPILFAGNGRETRFSFSLNYSTNVLTNPVWENLITNTWTLDRSAAANGLVGLSIVLPDNEQFPPREVLAGNLVFDFSAISDPLQARLQFTNAPTLFQAGNTNGTVLQMSGMVFPQYELLSARPALNRQSGLMEQQVRVAYAGAAMIGNVNLQVEDLGTDSLNNLTRLYNLSGVNQVDPDGDGVFTPVPFASAGQFGPGTNRILTLEYYVSDHVTVPDPRYQVLVEDFIIPFTPSAVTPLNITTNRFHNGTYIIQFNTIKDYLYYIEYAETLDDLVNNGPTSKVAIPPVPGTGFSLQWIDDGPPKTISRPTSGSRFYRVLELPVN